VLAAICTGFVLGWLISLGAHLPQNKALWGGGLFFALGAALFDYRTFDRRPRLIVDENGINAPRASIGFIPWSEVRETVNVRARYSSMEEDDYKRTELHFAAGRGDLPRVKQLVESGRSITEYDEIGYTPLHHAAKGEFFAVTTYLLSIGADINAHDEEHIGETPLGAVAASCSLEMAKLLVDAGANPTIAGWMGLTALYRAKQRKKSEGQKVYALLADIARRKFKYQP